jgi:hypothetical protein
MITKLDRVIDLHNGQYIQVVAKPHKVTLRMFPITSTLCDGLYNNAKINVTSVADEFFKDIKDCAQIAWPKIVSKVADSDASDYYAYYDSKRKVEYELGGIRGVVGICGYELNSMACYDFNKRRMQSYLYDLEEAYTKVGDLNSGTDI